MRAPDSETGVFIRNSWLPRVTALPSCAHNSHVENLCSQLSKKVSEFLRSSSAQITTELQIKTLTELCRGADSLLDKSMSDNQDCMLEPHQLLKQLKEKLSDLRGLTSNDINAKRLHLIERGLQQMIQRIAESPRNSPDNPNSPKRAA